MTNKAKYETRHPVKRALLNRFLTRTRSLVGVSLGSVLDVGSGEGLFWADAKPQSLVAVDIRYEALVEGRKRTGAAAVVGSALDLPFQDGAFDMVLAIEVLEHLLEPSLALDEIRRVTRHRAVVTVPWEPWFSLASLIGSGTHVRRLGREPEHVQAFGPKEMGALLEQRFTHVDVGTCFPWILASASI